MTRRLATVVACLLMLLALPATAGAQEPARTVPPANAAIDQYLETLPTVEGDRPAPRSLAELRPDPARDGAPRRWGEAERRAWREAEREPEGRWTADLGGSLPFTGLSLGVLALLGLGVLAAGALMRRRAGG